MSSCSAINVRHGIRHTQAPQEKSIKEHSPRRHTLSHCYCYDVYDFSLISSTVPYNRNVICVLSVVQNWCTRCHKMQIYTEYCSVLCFALRIECDDLMFGAGPRMLLQRHSAIVANCSRQNQAF